MGVIQNFPLRGLVMSRSYSLGDINENVRGGSRNFEF
jgi:hypothetical protein